MTLRKDNFVSDKLKIGSNCKESTGRDIFHVNKVQCKVKTFKENFYSILASGIRPQIKVAGTASVGRYRVTLTLSRPPSQNNTCRSFTFPNLEMKDDK